MNKTTERKVGSVLSYIQMFLQIIVSIIYTPIMIRLLGKSEYGLYNTVSSTISMLSILSLGFNSSYIRFYSKYKKRDDQDSINKLNGLFLLIFLVIGIVAFICGLFLTNNLELVFSQGLSVEEYDIARKLMMLMAINLAISFPMSVFSNIISAHEKFVFLKLIYMVKTVLTPMLNIPLLLMGYGSIGLVIMSLLLAVFTDVVFFIYVLFILKNKFVFYGFEKGLFKSLFNFTIFIALNLVVDEINTNLDKVILARYVGTVSVATYAVGFNLYNYYKMFSTSISGVFTPLIHSIQEQHVSDKEKYEQFTELFVKVGRIQFLILSLLLTGLIFFGKAFILFWVGEGYEDSYLVCILMAIPSTIPLIQNLGIEIQRAQNKHQFRTVIYFVMAIINLLLTIELCQKYGAVGAVIGTAISLIVANGIIMNVFYYKVCHINVLRFWSAILRIIIGMIPALLIGAIINNFADLNNIWILLGCIIIYTMSYILSIWFLSMNEYEKKIIVSPIKKLWSKMRREV